MPVSLGRMSSIIGHIVAGLTVATPCRSATHSRTRASWRVCVLLAVAPDFDYFAVWLFNYAANPRITHSLLFAIVTAWMARTLLRRREMEPSFAALLAASLSHPLLDLMVGAHSLPLLWPFAESQVSSPIGLLPSAGWIDPFNHLLWRNLLIELGVLLPVLGLALAIAHRTRLREILVASLFVAPVWCAFLGWSILLDR